MNSNERCFIDLEDNINQLKSNIQHLNNALRCLYDTITTINNEITTELVKENLPLPKASESHVCYLAFSRNLENVKFGPTQSDFAYLAEVFTKPWNPLQELGNSVRSLHYDITWALATEEDSGWYMTSPENSPNDNVSITKDSFSKKKSSLKLKTVKSHECCKTGPIKKTAKPNCRLKVTFDQSISKENPRYKKPMSLPSTPINKLRKGGVKANKSLTDTRSTTSVKQRPWK